MAMNSQYVENTLGQQASFAYDLNQVLPQMTVPVATGSQAGVPEPNTLPGEGQGGIQSVGSWATAANARGTLSHPIFWSVMLMVIGIFILSHVAHISTRSIRR